MKLTDIDLARFVPEVPEPVAAAELSASLVARRFKFLTADGQSATPLEQEALLGTNDLLDVNFLDRCSLARRCVGRIRILGGGRQGWATGFLIAPGVILTNHHVFPDAASVASSRIGFDYWFDVAGQRPADPDEFDLQPERLFVTNAELDYSVVAVAPLSAGRAAIVDRRYLRLFQESGKAKQGDFVTIIQHPDGVPMQIALRENQVIRAAEDEPSIWYHADTAHGSSGSPVFNDSLQVVALHSSGRIKREAGRYVLAAGGTTDNLDGLSESDVLWEANVGFRISRISQDLLASVGSNWPARLPEIEAAMRAGDIMSSTIQALAANEPPVAAAGPSRDLETEILTQEAEPVNVPSNSSSVVIPLQLRISLELGQAAAAVQIASGATALLETEAFEMRTPVIYDGLDQRRGFDPHFLDEVTPVPGPVVTPAGRNVLAPLLEGDDPELRYRHFSVWMHKERRLALYTASNVDWRKRAKTVDGKSTSRDGLAGWPQGSKYAELWVEDPRIASRYQLPDVFYSEDRGAFDKGHIVRRDDVCWGDHFEEIQMANGDTFHVTNCSPQTKAFNQGAAGQDNWGDLESAIAEATKKDAEAACIFAGPIFGADDRWFHGKDASGAARIQIPNRFWKIVVVKDEAAFQAYGFILEQDVRAVTEEEFYVTDNWRTAWTPIATIEKTLRGWLDLSQLAAIDQHAGA
ncbi:DNA/RNA non-specific endonuclease [Novosphingobium pokkalii]|uniref:DNA/RNA non-specific endonuclease n=1 Tax=Novosphingobium pokkalii TaxID=1770194 RepID=A0ABV7UY46_9SPHN|nr:DNA/RNA non-specific endonuclease [Novosphingobium pokkalii]GHC96951.1 hypothetical protein GCM10019060_27300 [Novosphingobium pokkalii]